MKKVLLVALAVAGVSLLSVVHATVIAENFSNDPLQNGWQVFGNTNLFQWDATNQDLAVTWNSTNQNSYFYRPLGTVLAIDDGFSLSFDLQLDAAAGSYEIGIGFLRLASATNSSFVRGTGSDSPNLAEFDYFPDYWSIDATTSDTNGAMEFVYDYTLPLETGVLYHVNLAHTPGDSLLTASVLLTNGVLYTSLPFAYPNPGFADFRLDTLSISCYSTNGDPYGDSLLAHGVVGNFTVTLPPPPVQNLAGILTNNLWQVQFTSRSNWLYTLQRTADFQTWTDVSPAVSGNATNLFQQDTNPPANEAFYRVSAERQ